VTLKKMEQKRLKIESFGYVLKGTLPLFSGANLEKLFFAISDK
jgi:hypothetical protein